MTEMVRQSRAAQAYEHIAGEILGGRWNPGDILSTYALAEELTISRTPISEALKRLEADGLVEIIPQVGCRISARHDLALITELCALCGVLAGLAAESAAIAITPEQCSDLESLAVETEQSAAAGDLHQLIDLTHQFCLRVAEASDMPRLLQVSRGMWSQLRHQLLGYQPVGKPMDGSLIEGAKQQVAIVRALKCAAGEEARLLSEGYIRGLGLRFSDNRSREVHASDGQSLISAEEESESYDAAIEPDCTRDQRHDQLPRAACARSDSRAG